jgi:ferric-dicitrate binding protein FerR (iron transport regulator)
VTDRKKWKDLVRQAKAHRRRRRRRRRLCGSVAACIGMACVLCALQHAHYHITYKNIILPSVLI